RRFRVRSGYAAVRGRRRARFRVRARGLRLGAGERWLRGHPEQGPCSANCENETQPAHFPSPLGPPSYGGKYGFFVKRSPPAGLSLGHFRLIRYRLRLEHDAEKWVPVFGKHHALARI